ncbi:PERQ amino acid-rich with GYF domain-containing protein 2 [Toxocara canis]|uniref:PERQ amino acid-rich with GYF domain-containing protein 2 n=1 Tax=Toxocara canis TaxID=6265 RepID=A0A0B2V8H4_TOXCA|nr:PERQ amino acid-rich with GYF domain-containing protein 2 [Toxocara canis]
MTTALPEANQMNFNPSWMRTAASTPSAVGNAANKTDGASPNESPQDYPLAEPIFVTNRYGREDLLALLCKDTSAPAGLDKCPFFVETAQQPIVLKPLTDVETRLQHNINSSKAMSSLSHADRVTIAAGGMIGQIGNPSSHSTTTVLPPTQPPFTPAWMTTPSGGGTGMGRGSLPFSRGVAHTGPFRGRGAHAMGAAGHAVMASDSSASSRYARGGRGGLTAQGRGGGTVGGAQFNSRAQGLYDPRDPRDRPRQRVRSVSDDTVPPTTGVVLPNGGIGGGTGGAPSATSSNGWTQVGRSGTSWGSKRASTVPTQQQQQGPLQEQRSVDATSTGTPAPMPEWMDDEHEKEDETASVGAGSFDENGQFRTRNALSKSSPSAETRAASSPHYGSADLPERQTSQTVEQSGTPPLRMSNPWNALADTSEQQRTEAVVERLAQQTEMNLILQNAPQQPGSTASASNIYQPKMHTGVSTLQHSMSQPASVGIVPGVSEISDDWYYIDPKNEVQGPFMTAHMEAWFSSGYFTSDLRIRRGADPNGRFITLGDLVRINGSISPFKRSVSPPTSATVVHVPMQARMHTQIQPQPQQLSRNIWTEDYNAVSLLEAAKVQEERQKLEEEQRRVAEQELKLKEMRESLLKEEEERLLRERKIRERELELQRQQEELARKAVEERERAMAREREIEAERKRMAEEMERVKQEQIERALAEARKREEEERLAAQRLAEEKEKERLKAEEERRRREQEEMERRIRAEEKEKEEAKRKAAIEEEQRKKREQADREAARQRAAEARKQAMSFYLNEFSKSAAATASKIVVTEEFAPATKPRQETANTPPTAWQTTYRVVDDKPVAPKVAPWVKASNEMCAGGEEGGRSILQIQREEEQRLREERHELKGREGVTPTSAAWGSSVAQKLSWNQPTQVTSIEPSATAASRGVAWGGAGVRVDSRPAVNLIWDGPPLDSTNKANKKSSSSSKSATSGNKASCQGAAKGNSANTEHEAMKKLFKQSVGGGGNAFTNWVVQRVKQLNSQVDADVFAAFIEGVDSPDEVEDYVIGYLGDGRQVKDFIREFIEKRREARSKKQLTDKDDLTHAAVGADALGSSNVGGGSCGSQHTQGGGGKKKKKGGKGSKVVVDGACLGFKATADPNRTNIGEIDTVQPPADPYRR